MLIERLSPALKSFRRTMTSPVDLGAPNLRGQRINPINLIGKSDRLLDRQIRVIALSPAPAVRP